MNKETILLGKTFFCKLLEIKNMTTHTFHIKLDSNVIRLRNVDDLLGKRVEITIRELANGAVSNFATLQQLLENQASPAFFQSIIDPAQWQKNLRDEWE